jgi:phage FluMu protein Com
MKDIRCPLCGWKLFIARGEGEIQIKCPRCKKIVTVKIPGQSEPHSK